MPASSGSSKSVSRFVEYITRQTQNRDGHALEQRLRTRLFDLLESEWFGRSEDPSEPDEFKVAGGGGLFVHVGEDERFGHWSQIGVRSGRSILGLIRHHVALVGTSAETWAKTWLDSVADLPLPDRVETAGGRRRTEAERVGDARLHWHRARQGSLGDAGRRYLERRGLVLSSVPASVAYIPLGEHGREHGLIFAAYRPGETWPHAVQHIYLTIAGEKRAHGRDGVVKRSRGLVSGAAVRLPGETDGAVVYHAEGPETGLTVWLATGCTTFVHLHGIPADYMIHAPQAREHVLCLDDAAPGHRSPALPHLEAIAAAANAGGYRTRIATPFTVTGELDADFNDLAINGMAIHPHDPLLYARMRLTDAGGRRVLKNEAADTSPTASEFGRSTSGHGPTIMPLERAEQALREALDWHLVADWYGARQEHANDPSKPDPGPATVRCYRVETGLGKTEQGLAMARDLIAHHQGPGVLSAPTYALAIELCQRAVAMGIDARVAFHRINPHVAVCANADGVKKAMEEGVEDIQRHLCGNGGPGSCVHHATCPFQAQRRARPALWITTTARLFGGSLEELGEFHWLIIDEGVVREMLPGVPRELADRFLDLVAERSDVRVARLLDKLRQAFRMEGWARAEHVRRHLTVHEVQELTRRLSALKEDLGDLKNLGRREIAERMREMDIPEGWNTRLTTLILVTLDLLPMIDGPVAVSGRIKLHETGMQLYRPGEMLTQARGIPTFILDATLNLDLTRRVFDRATPVVMALDVMTESPGMVVRQDARHANGKQRLASSRDAREAREDRIYRVLDRLAPATTLLIAQKAVIDETQRDDRLPWWVTTAHYNALRGIDRYREVDRIVLVGQISLTPSDLETAAGALIGERLADADRVEALPTRPVRVGSLDRPVLARYHPHPLCEAIRQQAEDAEVVQAIGRGRGARRVPGRRLEVIMLNRAITPWADRTLDLHNLW